MLIYKHNNFFMIPRILSNDVKNALEHNPVVGLLGSRQVGKTTLLGELKGTFQRELVYLDLEKPSDVNKLSEPELYFNSKKNALFVIDEVQRKPELFPLIRVLTDERKINGQFILSGSASPHLIRMASESLAGRVKYFNLSPLNILEITAVYGSNTDIINRLWIRGGYPRSFLAGTDANSFDWRMNFIQTYLERDIPQLGLRIPSSRLRQFWTLLAHVHAQVWNASTLAQSMGLSGKTVNHYLDILEDTFLIRRLLPFQANVKKRLVKSPKVYFVDSGLQLALLNVQNFDQLFSNPILGASWEGFVMQQILEQKPQDWSAYYYRTQAGAEVDLVLVPPQGKPVPVEIKHSLSPTIGRGFRESFADLEAQSGYFVYSGKEQFPLAKNITAIGINDLSKLFASTPPFS